MAIKIKSHSISAKQKILTLVTAILFGLTNQALASQESLIPVVNKKAERNLKFDWPMINIGTASYEEGPTGATVIHFGEKSSVAIDVRGGGPGTVNAPYMEMGYPIPELDTIVIAGGSWYGLEATTAVASALKDDGIRDGNAFTEVPNIAMSVGSIIFDFGGRRLNEIYPDKKLGQAAFRAAKTGSFPLGAIGAARFAKSGGFFGCNSYSGQGAAFKQIGKVKLAAFTVVNAYGSIVDRDGNVPSCYTKSGVATNVPVAELFSDFGKGLEKKIAALKSKHKQNTTISVLVTNQKLKPAYLKRLAVQVNTSMARSLQPYGTLYDGDVFYAVSTEEIEDGELNSVELGVIASELMWDAVLSSVPEQPAITKPISKRKLKTVKLSKGELAKMVGVYKFSAESQLKVTSRNDKLFAKSMGRINVYAIPSDKEVELKQVSKFEFTVSSRYPFLMRFEKKGQLVINPGHWQQVSVNKTES